METKEVVELLEKADKAISEHYQCHSQEQSIAGLAIEKINEQEKQIEKLERPLKEIAETADFNYAAAADKPTLKNGLASVADKAKAALK